MVVRLIWLYMVYECIDQEQEFEISELVDGSNDKKTVFGSKIKSELVSKNSN